MKDLEEVQECCKELRACRDNPANKGAATILPIFKKLSRQQLDTKDLRSTGVGKEVNDPFFRNHADVKVRNACAELVNKWKAIAMGRSAPAPRPPSPPSPPSAPSAAPPAASPSAPSAPPLPSSTTSSKEKRKQTEKAAGKAEKAKRSKKAEKAEVAESPNQELAAQFKELAAHEFKKGGASKFAGIAFNKVVAVLQGLEEKVTSGKSIAHLQGIGKESVKKIDQYLEKGIIDKLERIRNGEED